MAAYNKFDVGAENIVESHNMGTDVFKIALTNTAPLASQATWNVADHPAPAAANGYPAGGNTIVTTSSSQAAGLYKLILQDSVFTATPGGIGPFRYVILYNSTDTPKALGWYDYGSSITLADTEILTVDFSAANGAITVQ